MNPDKNKPGKIEREKNITDFEYIKTDHGSIYKVLFDGRTQRYKTATGELDEPMDLIVFFEIIDDFKKQRFLKGVQKRKESGTKVYVVDRQGNRINKNEETLNKEINLVLVDSKTNKILEFAPATNMPKIGLQVFDQRRFEINGEPMREMHIGNKVVEIKER